MTEFTEINPTRRSPDASAHRHTARDVVKRINNSPAPRAVPPRCWRRLPGPHWFRSGRGASYRRRRPHLRVVLSGGLPRPLRNTRLNCWSSHLGRGNECVLRPDLRKGSDIGSSTWRRRQSMNSSLNLWHSNLRRGSGWMLRPGRPRRISGRQCRPPLHVQLGTATTTRVAGVINQLDGHRVVQFHVLHPHTDLARLVLVHCRIPALPFADQHNGEAQVPMTGLFSLNTVSPPLFFGRPTGKNPPSRRFLK